MTRALNQAAAAPEVQTLNELYRARSGNAIRRLRESLCLAQEELANRINALIGSPIGTVTAGQISRWERGQQRPQPRYRRLLAEALQCDIADLKVDATTRPLRDQRVPVTEVWLRVTDRRVTALLVHADESTRTQQVAARSVPGVQREITGYLIGRGFHPVGPWEGCSGDFVRRFTPTEATNAEEAPA